MAALRPVAIINQVDHGEADSLTPRHADFGGELERARRHWRAYLALDPDSLWAAEVRARLRRTDRALAPVSGDVRPE